MKLCRKMQKTTLVRCWETSAYMLCRQFHQSQFLRDNDFLGLKSLSLDKQSPFMNIITNAVKDEELSKRPPEFLKFLKDYSFGFKTSVKALINTLNINRKNAKGIVLKHKLFEKVPIKFIEENYTLLKNAGLTEEAVQENALVLTEEPNILARKIGIVKKLDVDLNLAVPLLTQNLRELRNAANVKNHVINYNIKKIKIIAQIADNLQINEHDMEKIHDNMTYQRYLRSIGTKVQHLEKYGVDVENIGSEWYKVLHFSQQKIHRRLKIASKFGWHITPHLIGCSTEELFRKRKLHLRDLKSKEFKQFDRYKFIKDLSRLTKLDPLFLKFKLFKFDETFFNDPHSVYKKMELINQEGFSNKEIIWNSEVLILPIEQIQERFSKLRLNNCQEWNLNVLLLPDEQFEEYLSAPKKKNVSN